VTAPAPDALVAELQGEHGSGLVARLRGAQRMHDAGKPLSTWVTKEIDNEAADWIEQAADRIESDAKTIATLTAERDAHKRRVDAYNTTKSADADAMAEHYLDMRERAEAAESQLAAAKVVIEAAKVCRGRFIVGDRDGVFAELDSAMTAAIEAGKK